MCDLCSEYGVQTVSVKIRSKRTEVQMCFRCLAQAQQEEGDK